ncbi:MAG: two-component system VirA-like sensor kinase [Geminicoccaceae bacterium]
MIRSAWRLLPILAGLLLVLTYLLLRGASPDPGRTERTLEALHALILNDAALHRDVLRARAGLLPSYDPLVEAIRGLHGAIDTLRIAASSEAGAGIERHLRALVTSVSEQEALTEAFKSDNALLQNSLTYFTHASHELGKRVGDGRPTMAAEIAELVNAMLRFMREPRGDAAGEVSGALERLDRLSERRTFGADIGTLVAHARIIVNTLPNVDAALGRLLTAATAERARALQDAYLDHHGRIEARAEIFRVLLYLASVLLLAYLGYLFLRLRANVRALAERSGALQERVTFESLVTGVSAHFINLPPDRVDHGINQALARLGDYTGVDRAYILLFGADGRTLDRSHAWQRAGIRTPGGCRGDPLVAESSSSLERFVQQGSVHVPSVCALPSTPEKTALAERGTRSWLCLPMWCAGKRVGLLGFDAVQAEKRWSDDDIALLRTVGEIFANALERKRAEAERAALEAQLRQSQRMEAIGTLAGGIAHNFNNILGAILGYGEMALSALPQGSGAHRYLQQVMTAGQRGKGVVDQILAFSRRAEHERRSIRVQPVVEEAIDLLRASLPTTIDIRPRLQAGDAAVLGDPTQLQQVVVNLSTNAAQAMQGRGTLEVGVDALSLANGRTLSHGTLEAGRYLRLTVRDSGQGMDDATMERIFEPFFTTKAPGSGTGLGLATVHGIVAEHDGAIDVRSRLGRGSTVEVYLAQTETHAPDQYPAETPAPSGHGETILLIDDETPLMLLGEEMLAALGYEPVGFDSSVRALAAFCADPQRFDLLLADEVMPEMTGTQLAAEVHRIRPALPIVLMTGYGGPIEARGLRAAGICEVLRKPLSSAEIAASLARHLVQRRRDHDR